MQVACCALVRRMAVLAFALSCLSIEEKIVEKESSLSVCMDIFYHCVTS